MIATTRAGRVAVLAYVGTVAAIAAVGFSTDSTGAILLAGLLALPTSVPAAIAYYVGYGLLAQLPGANPDSASGSMSCSAAGQCQDSSTGGLATWFAFTADVVGIAALVVSAALNVVLLRTVIRGRRAASARTRSGA